ncbi:MAG TPA: multicopper oxidase domain-containing protein [Vicinamibacterales bacterium]|nr:multicopper oxidase domain-containing protein [Vicinamibacterales bacterium]
MAPHGVNRRQALQMGAAGLASLGIVPALDAPASAAQTPGSGQGQRPPQPPALRDVVDVAALRGEDWTEPWMWRQSEWPNDALALQVVTNAHPPRATSPGNRFTPLFSFNGSSPAPTIRMRGDETLRIKLRNLMGPNRSQVPKGHAPDPFEQHPKTLEAIFCAVAKSEGLPCTGPPPPGSMLFRHFDEFLTAMGVPLVDSECLPTAANVPHGSHNTNLHTHGLHVEPNQNDNGTYGDHIFLRVLPKADGETRRRSTDPACRQLTPDERVAEADFEHRLGNVQGLRRQRSGPPQPHPPGTHWYHPHAHGAVHAQVSSGMAGFLIVEGDVDDAVNTALAGTARPDPCIKTGPFDYRERLMMIQRAEVAGIDTDHGPRRGEGRLAPPATAVNGGFAPTTIFMRPGAVERWRVLNASIDGRGFKQFMVLEGQFVFADRQLWRVVPGKTAETPRELIAATRADVEAATRPIHLLAFDGLTLVTSEGGQVRHTIRDLSTQRAGTINPLTRPPQGDEPPNRAMLRNVEDCYKDGESLRNAFVRPNQVFLANANRADVFFKAPLDAAGKVYTIFAQEFMLQTDNFQQRLQQSVSRGAGFNAANPAPIDVVVGYVRVGSDPVPGGDFDVMSLVDRLPPVPPYLQPIGDDEIRVPVDEAQRRGIPAGSFRSRVVSYSGNGPTEFPLIEVPASFADAHPELKRRLWEEVDGVRVLLPPFGQTMAVNADFDLAANPEPPMPRKFEHHGSAHSKVLVDTAEEWVLYNCSMALWGHTDTAKRKQPGQYSLHFTSYPIGRAEGQARFAREPEFQITTKGADHPFHIHVNPCWVTRIEVPDAEGRLHNLLSEPRWMDTISIPRQGGRVVFRSRFADYVGTWVHHCHILNHEDFGMMATVEGVEQPEDANYRPRTAVASHAATAEAVTAIYPRPSLELMYRQNLSYVEAHPVVGCTYPGFPIVPPKLTD